MSRLAIDAYLFYGRFAVAKRTAPFSVLKHARNVCMEFGKLVVIHLHLRANDVNSDPFSIYVYENTTPQTIASR